MSHKYIHWISRGVLPRAFAYAEARLWKFNLCLAQIINLRSPSFFLPITLKLKTAVASETVFSTYWIAWYCNLLDGFQKLLNVFADRRLVIAFTKCLSLNLCHIIMFSVALITYCSSQLLHPNCLIISITSLSSLQIFMRNKWNFTSTQ